jgi:uncharacterized protein YukE
MKKLSKVQLTQKEAHQKALEKAHEKLQQAIETFNEERAALWAKVDEAKEALQTAVEEANEWLDEMRSDAQSYYDERTEKWQEGDAGQTYQEWIGQFENELEEVNLEEPEDIDVPESPAEQLDQIAEEPGG